MNFETECQAHIATKSNASRRRTRRPGRGNAPRSRVAVSQRAPNKFRRVSAACFPQLRVRACNGEWIASPGMQIGWKTVNASEPAAGPVLFRPRVTLAGDWRLPRRELGLKGLGSGQKFTSESLEIVRHPAIRFGAGQAKVSFCPQAQICRVLHGGNSLMRGLSPRRNLSQLPLARAPLCAAGCSIFERRHSCIGM